MKLNKKINIDIFEFLQTGKFDSLEPNQTSQTKEWILNNFPDPDYFGIGDTLDNAAIWCYGNVELHFDQQKLFMIYSDYIKDLSGGKSLELNPWILGKEGDFSLERIIREFNTMRMDFSVLYRGFEDMIEIIITKSEVKLTFHGEDGKEDPNKYQLGSFSLMG